MRILLVEDDSMIGQAVLDALRDAPYATDWVTDGLSPVTVPGPAGESRILLRYRCVLKYITKRREVGKPTRHALFHLLRGSVMHPLRRVLLDAFYVLSLLASGVAQAGEVQVAVAANFAGPMTRIAQDFGAASGHSVKVSTGATGKFYTQIVAGAPFEVLIAADDETPKKLIAEGHAVAGSNFTYAIGKLVLWSAQPGYVDDQGSVLVTGQYAHLAIANPKTAPYGAAGLEVIKARGLLDAIGPRLVTGESIGQAYQFVATGNAELGFVALSQVAVPGKPVTGSYWLVPASLYGEIRQDAVLLKTGEGNPAAAALLSYLRGDAARAIIQSFGYGH